MKAWRNRSWATKLLLLHTMVVGASFVIVVADPSRHAPMLYIVFLFIDFPLGFLGFCLTAAGGEYVASFLEALRIDTEFVNFDLLPAVVFGLFGGAQWFAIGWGVERLGRFGTGGRFPPGHCRRCGYDLTGNVSGRCPECGSPAPRKRLQQE